MNQPFLTALAAVAGFLGKSLWDLYWKHRDQNESLARQKRIDFLERQLSLFYWPVYMHLQKNNVVWEHLVKGKAIDINIKKAVDQQLYRTFFLPNHEHLVSVIEANIHLAQPDSALETLLLRFIRHVEIFKALRDLGHEHIDPIGLGEPWPTDLFPAIEVKLREVQSIYDREIGRRATAT
jgi:hypothetical protein